jgi:hypothetical protein
LTIDVFPFSPEELVNPGRDFYRGRLCSGSLLSQGGTPASFALGYQYAAPKGAGREMEDGEWKSDEGGIFLPSCLPYPIVFNRLQSFSIVFNRFLSFSIVFYRFLLFSIVSNRLLFFSLSVFQSFSSSVFQYFSPFS